MGHCPTERKRECMELKRKRLMSTDHSLKCRPTEREKGKKQNRWRKWTWTRSRQAALRREQLQSNYCDNEALRRKVNLVTDTKIISPRWRYEYSVLRTKCLHRELGIETVTDIIAKFAKPHEKRLQDQINTEASRFLNVNNITRRLKRKKASTWLRRG
jgi:uncharacterized protein YeeX (DUF496 family)